jgi:hypothetical protein
MILPQLTSKRELILEQSSVKISPIKTSHMYILQNQYGFMSGFYVRKCLLLKIIVTLNIMF